MDTPSEIKPTKKRVLAWIWISISYLVIMCSFAITISAFLGIRSSLHQFDMDAASLAPGTPIRPMGMEMGIGLAWTFSLLVGGACALFSGIISLIQRRKLQVILAIVAGIAAWVPMFYSTWGIRHIVELRHLVMEP